MLQGDPYALRYTASRFGAGAGELRRQASRLVGHQTQLVGYEWSGTAAVSFAGKNEQQVGYMRQQADVLERAASVLTDLAGKIERVQELRRQAEQIQMASWEYNDDTPDSIHHRQNLAHQAARLRQQADMEASEADSLAAGRFHEIMSGVPDVVVLPDAVWSYYKRHPELVEQAEDDEYGQDRNQLLAAFRQYYTSKQPDYLPDEVRAEAAEQYLKYLYDLSNEQLYDRLQDLLGEDEEAAYYRSLIQDPDFDADKQLDDDEAYQNYIKKQLAQNESPGSVYMAGTAFAVGIMKAMGPKYSTEGEHFTRVNGKKALKPNFQYTTEEGYTYTTDEKGRIKSVEADLQVGDGKRNPYAQRKAGGEDRNPDDDGGHLIASMFKGSGDLDNLVPMNSQVNRAGGKWYEMEQEWKQALTGEPPKPVRVSIEPVYEGDSTRPVRFEITYTIGNGKPKFNTIVNQAGG